MNAQTGLKRVYDESVNPLEQIDQAVLIHIQDSSFLEEGKSYNLEKVLRFFKNWTPKAVMK